MSIIKGVYFILAPNQQKVKIGRSRNIETRYRNLRTGFMDDGFLIMGIESDDEVKLEYELHRKFENDRIKNEWFFLSENLRSFLVNNESNYGTVKRYKDFVKLQNVKHYNNNDTYAVVKKIRESSVIYGAFLFQLIISVLH